MSRKLSKKSVSDLVKMLTEEFKDIDQYAYEKSEAAEELIYRGKDKEIIKEIGLTLIQMDIKFTPRVFVADTAEITWGWSHFFAKMIKRYKIPINRVLVNYDDAIEWASELEP